MAKYVCSICGYTYDEGKGIPESGFPAGTPWSDLPDSWVCPLCGAAKSAFEMQGDAPKAAAKRPSPVIQTPKDTKELSLLEMSALCTNLPVVVKSSIKLKKQNYS
jgi:rubredoxin